MKTTLAGFLLSIMVAACTNPAETADVLPGDGGMPSLAVIVQEHEADGTTTERKIAPDVFADAVEQYCKTFTNITAGQSMNKNCVAEAALSWQALCAAHKSLELAQAVSATDFNINELTANPDGGAGIRVPRRWTVPPQPSTGSATLARLGMRFSRAAIDDAADGLEDSYTDAPAPAAGSTRCVYASGDFTATWLPSTGGPTGPIDIGTHLASILVEAYHVGGEASDLDAQ